MMATTARDALLSATDLPFVPDSVTGVVNLDIETSYAAMPLTLSFVFDPFGELVEIDADGPLVATTRATPRKGGASRPAERQLSGLTTGEVERLRSDVQRLERRVRELEDEVRWARERSDELEEELAEERATVRQLRTLEARVKHAIAGLQDLSWEVGP